VEFFRLPTRPPRPARARPQSADPARPPVRLRGRFAAGAVERALAGARLRLERPQCQRLLSEFADAEGRPLTDALEAEGTTAAEHLGRLVYYDGAGQGPCERPATLAFTVPRGHVVFVCAETFLSAARRDPLLAEATLIHEGLHTLGLGENPPASPRITSRVVHLCR
jgi:hypothetical protein